MVLGLISAALAASLVQDPTIEIPFRIGESAIIVDAKVNGKDVSLMFDSGFAGAFVIGPHINLGEATGKINLKDFVGVFQANTIEVTSVQMGEFKLEPDDMQIAQLPTLDFTRSYGTHVDGIMGLQVFKDNVTEINFEHKKFIIHPPSHDISRMKPDKVRTFLAKMLPIGHNSIEMEVWVGDGQRLILALDTGNGFYATTHRDVLQKKGLWRTGAEPDYMGRSQIASGVVESWSILLEDTIIFGVPVKTSIWDVIDLPSSSAEHNGTVGFGFLKHFNITIDLKRRKVWLENFDGVTAEEPLGHIGIAATYSKRESRMVIVSVTPNGPAEKAGVKVGDHLISIGGERLIRSTYRHVKSVLSGKPGTEIGLEISSRGQLKRMTLTRKLLVNRARG